MYEIREMHLKLDPCPEQPEVRAHVTFVYGGLCVRRVQVIQCSTGKLRVNFPDHPVKAPCVRCSRQVCITVRFCCHCGKAQPFRLPALNPRTGMPHKYNSVVFPVGSEARAWFEAAILRAFVEASITRAKAS